MDRGGMMNHFQFASLISLVPSLRLWRLFAFAGAFPIIALFVLAAAMDGSVSQLMADHQVSATAIILFVFSAASSSMRNPPDGFYNWFFRFVNILSANSMAFMPAELQRATK